MGRKEKQTKAISKDKPILINNKSTWLPPLVINLRRLLPLFYAYTLFMSTSVQSNKAPDID